jgi:hypothetical protein
MGIKTRINKHERETQYKHRPLLSQADKLTDYDAGTELDNG